MICIGKHDLCSEILHLFGSEGFDRSFGAYRHKGWSFYNSMSGVNFTRTTQFTFYPFLNFKIHSKVRRKIYLTSQPLFAVIFSEILFMISLTSTSVRVRSKD